MTWRLVVNNQPRGKGGPSAAREKVRWTESEDCFLGKGIIIPTII
jgi:hypothetical protein